MSVCLICLSQCLVYLSLYLLSGCLSAICLYGCLSIYLCVSGCLSAIWLSICLFMCLSAIWVSICLSGCLPVYLSIWVSIWVYICLSGCISDIWVSICHLGVYLSIGLPAMLCMVCDHSYICQYVTQQFQGYLYLKSSAMYIKKARGGEARG